MINRIKIQILAVWLFSLLIAGCGRTEAEELQLLDAGDIRSEEVETTAVHTDEATLNGLAKEGTVQTDSATGDLTGEDTKVPTVKVYVCGAVTRPGVYELLADARVADALVKAGNLTPEADVNYLNLAEHLTDGSRIYVPTSSETAELKEIQGSGVDVCGIGGDGTLSPKSYSLDGIDLNHATLQELKSLPGIGDVKASAIIAYRESHGRFEKVEQLMEVDGIKQGLYNQVRDFICVR